MKLISTANEKNKELHKYTEKVVRTEFFAENLYGQVSKSLNNSRKELSSQKKLRRLKLINLQLQESELSKEIETIEKGVVSKIYQENALKSKIDMLSNKIEGLIYINSENRSENLVNIKYAKKIKEYESKLKM